MDRRPSSRPGAWRTALALSLAAVGAVAFFTVIFMGAYFQKAFEEELREKMDKLLAANNIHARRAAAQYEASLLDGMTITIPDEAVDDPAVLSALSAASGFQSSVSLEPVFDRSNTEATANLVRRVSDPSDDLDDGGVGCTYIPKYDTNRPLPTDPGYTLRMADGQRLDVFSAMSISTDGRSAATTPSPDTTVIPQTSSEVQPQGFKTIVTRAGDPAIDRDVRDNVHTLAPRFTLPTKVRSDYPTSLTPTWWLHAGGIIDQHFVAPETWDVSFESTVVSTTTAIAGADRAVPGVAARDVDDVLAGFEDFLDLFDPLLDLDDLVASGAPLDEALIDDLKTLREFDTSGGPLEARSSGPKWQAVCKAFKGAIKDKKRWQDLDYVAYLRKNARECTEAGFHVPIPSGLPKVAIPISTSTPEPTKVGAATKGQQRKSPEAICHDAERKIKRLYKAMSRTSWMELPARHFRVLLEIVRECREQGILQADPAAGTTTDTIPLPPDWPLGEGQPVVEGPPPDSSPTRRVPKVPAATDESTRQIMTEGHRPTRAPAPTPASVSSSPTPAVSASLPNSPTPAVEKPTHRIPKVSVASDGPTRQIMTEGRRPTRAQTPTPASSFSSPTLSSLPVKGESSTAVETSVNIQTYRIPKLPIPTPKADH